MTGKQSNALEQRRERVAYAKRLGVEKPHTLKKEALEQAIAELEAVKASEKATRDADPMQDGEIHDCEHGKMQVLEGGQWVCPPECAEPAEEDIADVVAERGATREAWLLAGIQLLIPLLEQAGAVQVRHRKIQVSVGFPSKTVRKRMGECWASRASDNGGIINMLVSPLVDEPVEVLHFLLHESIHADDDCESGHNGHFRKIATRVGLVGKMTETEIGEDLRPVLKDIAEELGPYPHVKLKMSGAQKTQTTRLLKAQCPDEECPLIQVDKKGKQSRYNVNMVQSWVEVGMPTCPCGTEMEIVERTKKQKAEVAKPA